MDVLQSNNTEKCIKHCILNALRIYLCNSFLDEESIYAMRDWMKIRQKDFALRWHLDFINRV